MVASLPTKTSALFIDDFNTQNIAWAGWTPTASGQAMATPGNGSVSQGGTWTVTSGGVAQLNGSNAGFTSGVLGLWDVNGTIWVVNVSDQWFFWTGATWTAGSAPVTTGWIDHYPFGGNEAFLPAVGEQEYMCSAQAGYSTSTAYQPFSVANSVLTITAESASLSGDTNPSSQPWNGGTITSCHEISGSPATGLFSFSYGYVEARVQTPAGGPIDLSGPGFWPQLVLYPLNGVGPVELDIFEILGGSPTTIRQTVHDSLGGTTFFTSTANVNTGFHRIGVDLQPSTITFYVDGVQTNQMATPSGFGGQFYINCGLAVGGSTSWSGTPVNAQHVDPGSFLIDYIGVWANYQAAYPPPVNPPNSMFLWEGAGSYGVSVANLLSTELNSLAFVTSGSNTLSTLGSAFQNTNMRMFCDIEFLAGAGITTAAGALLEVWFLRSLDAGSHYEDGSSSIAPARPADVVIPVRAGTNITPRAGLNMIILPPGFYKPIARNQVTTLPASGNIVRFVNYSPGY